jgi:hypothetical protein
MNQYFLSCDLGQQADFTAISVLQSTNETGKIIHLERLKLGMPYPAQVERIKALYQHLSTFKEQLHLIVDGTGVGVAVVDLIKQAGMIPIALTITSGNEASKDGYIWHIPKRDLISSLLVSMQTGNLKIARLPEADTLVKELQNFKLKVNIKTGHDSYEAWRESDHDDLVLSVAMACYAADIGKPPKRQVSRPYNTNTRSGLPGGKDKGRFAGL